VVHQVLSDYKKVWFRGKQDNCIYAKFRKGKYIFFVLYVDDILLASSDKDLLAETKRFLSSNVDMKGM
jgi:hypothetical protein